MCGIAAGQGVEEKPTDELCAVGKASKVKGKGPWTWTCAKGKKKTSCEAPKLVDAVCGKANGSIRKGTPTTDLCKTGTPTAIQGEGPWLWSCVGSGGGISVSCSSAPQMQRRADGACGLAASTTMMTAPKFGLCDSGNPSSVNGQGPWTWTCSGINGGKDSSCVTQKTSSNAPPAPAAPVVAAAPGGVVNGLCGTSNGAAVASQPLEGLCDAGTATPITGTGPWSWTCAGSIGGVTVSCTALSQSATPNTGIASPLSPQPLQETAPKLPASSFPAAAPTPSAVPSAPKLEKTEALPSGTEPTLPEEAKPLPPPPVSEALPPAPALKSQGQGLGTDVAPLSNTSFALDEDLATVPFDRGEENIDPAELPTLDKLADVLVNNGNIRITLTSYANANGASPREARRMSLTRALAVRDYLTAKGVVSSRIDVRALGSNVPSGDTDRIDVKVE
jgi:outer membrane protein OmpA-like peptidoglycan-associated protein